MGLQNSFELKQSSKALRALNARWALPVYPVFEDEKSKALEEKSVERKIAKKRKDKYNCYKLRLRAINHYTPKSTILLKKIYNTVTFSDRKNS